MKKDEAWEELEKSRLKWGKKCAELPKTLEIYNAPIGSSWVGQVKGGNNGWVLVKKGEASYTCSW
jgi:hypothetical protein